LLALKGDAESAIRLIDGHHAGRRRRDPDLLVLKGNVLGSEGDFRGAACAYAQALRVDPRHPRALLDQGDLLASSSRSKAVTKRALRRFRMALRAIEDRGNPRRFAEEFIDASLGATDALRALGRPREAIVVVARGLVRHPDDERLFAVLDQAREDLAPKRRSRGASRASGRR
jgi:tetratricopeptide (TPR) repeat protein